jgi:hypothetical protein
LFGQTEALLKQPCGYPYGLKFSCDRNPQDMHFGQQDPQKYVSNDLRALINPLRSDGITVSIFASQLFQERFSVPGPLKHFAVDGEDFV